jgi:hypothetical protein
LRRPLHGGTVQVAHGVPFRLSELRWAATWSVGVLGAMYTVVDYSRTMLPSGPARSCRSLANSSWRFGWAVRRRVPSWFGFLSSCSASAVTRFRGPVSRSFGFLAGYWARRILVVCFGCVLRRMASFVWFLGPVSLINWIMFFLS